MEQLNLEVTQRMLRDRQAQVVRDAEMRRVLRERAALSRRDDAAADAVIRSAPRRRLAGLAALLRHRRRPAIT